MVEEIYSRLVEPICFHCSDLNRNDVEDAFKYADPSYLIETKQIYDDLLKVLSINPESFSRIFGFVIEYNVLSEGQQKIDPLSALTKIVKYHIILAESTLLDSLSHPFKRGYTGEGKILDYFNLIQYLADKAWNIEDNDIRKEIACTLIRTGHFLVPRFKNFKEVEKVLEGIRKVLVSYAPYLNEDSFRRLGVYINYILENNINNTDSIQTLSNYLYALNEIREDMIGIRKEKLRNEIFGTTSRVGKEVSLKTKDKETIRCVMDKTIKALISRISRSYNETNMSDLMEVIEKFSEEHSIRPLMNFLDSLLQVKMNSTSFRKIMDRL